MEFKQVSQNGIVPPTPLKTRQSKLGLMISTTSTVYGQPVILRAVSDASINKFEPAYFYNYRNEDGVATYTLLGTSTWVANISTLVTTDLGTGTNNVYCVWPGEGTFAPQSTWPNVGVINLTGGTPLDGPMTIAAYPGTGQVVAGEGVVTFAVSFATELTLTGNVQFYANNSLIGVAAISGNQAVLSVTTLPAGVSIIKAVLPSFVVGSTTYAATSVSIDYEMLIGAPIAEPMVLSFEPDTIVAYEGDLTIKATINGTTNLPGLVSFYKGNQFVGTGVFVDNTAQVEITNNIPVGEIEFSADWDGNQSSIPKYQPKTTSTTVTVVERNTLRDFVLTASSYKDVYDINFPVLYATANTTTQVTGVVNFIESGILFGQSPFVNNVAAFTATNLTTGTYFITAQYAGSSVAPKFYSTVSNTIEFTVAPNYETSIVVSGTPNPVYQLNTGSFVINAVDTFSNTYSGIVTVSDVSYEDNIVTTSTFQADSQVVYYDIEDVAFLGTETMVVFTTVQDLVANRDLRFTYPDVGVAPWLATYSGPKETGIYKIASINTATKTVMLHGPKYGSQDAIYDVLTYWQSLFQSGISNETYQNTIYPGFEVTPGLGSSSTITVTSIVSTEVLGTGTWLTTNTFKLIFDPNTVEPNDEYDHFIVASWPGQPADGAQLPYSPATSNLFNQVVTKANLIQTLNTTSITIADPLRVIHSVDTSTVAKAYTVSVLKNGTTASTATSVNNSATIVLPAGTFSSGTFTITSLWNLTNPLVVSNSATITVSERAEYPGTLTLTGPSKVYQLDNAPMVATLSLNTATSGTVSLNYYNSYSTATSLNTVTTINTVISLSTATASPLRINGTTSTAGLFVTEQTSTVTLINTTVTTSTTVIGLPSNTTITTVTNTVVNQVTTATTTRIVENYATSATNVEALRIDQITSSTGEVLLDIPVPLPAGWNNPNYFRGYVKYDNKRGIITSYDTSTKTIYYSGEIGDYPFIQFNRYSLIFEPYYQIDASTATQISTTTNVTAVTEVTTQSYEVLTFISSASVSPATRSVSIVLPPRNETTASLKIIAQWSGQGWYPAQSVYPYYGVSSNIVTQDITAATMTIAATTGNNYYTSSTVVATVNTSSVNTVTTVTFYNGTATLASRNIVGNTATLVINRSTLPAGYNTISAKILGTNPVITSNTQTIYAGQFPEGYVATTTNLVNFNLGLKDSSGNYFYDQVLQKNIFFPTTFNSSSPIGLPLGRDGQPASLGYPTTGSNRFGTGETWQYTFQSLDDQYPITTGDFTVEYFIKCQSVPPFQAGGTPWFKYGPLNVDFNNVGTNLTYIVLQGVQTNALLQAGQWYHIAWVRYNGTLDCYINGIKKVTQSNSTDMSNYLNHDMLFNISGEAIWDKIYVDDLRITNGARYMGTTFSVPSSPLGL